ncbi:energy transducer TonB [Cetobacterium sp.]|uniref:energy transducer TonB n=1 Tax=Cetobacterium sp. TaxID=2071632 RepID=UPI0025D7C160|nr:energy transducer TonB [uncultured Cetobacterium sp.]
MSKFYIYSAVLHILVIVSVTSFYSEKEQKFKEKNTMVVSVKNRKAISSQTQVNFTSEKEIPEMKTIPKEKPIEKEKKKEIKKIKRDLKKVEKSEALKETSKEIQKEKYNEFQNMNKFLQGEDGVFTAISSEGIEYEILKEIDPQYPVRAKKSGYKGMGSVKVKFLVDIDGSVKNIQFLSGEQRFGFKEEVEKALKEWKFKPIQYKNKNIKVYFEKEFKFKKN